MSGDIVGDPGPPMRCLWIGSGKFRRKICFAWPIWPRCVLEAYPRVPGPDPWPLNIKIEGVDPKVIRELMILDAIQFLSKGLSGETGRLVGEATDKGVAQIKQRLPSDVSLV